MTTLNRTHLAGMLAFAAIVLATQLQNARAQSLFERRSSNQVDQYRNYAAHNRGDLLSILINESTDVANRDERSMDKSGSSSVSGSLDYGFGGSLGSTAGDGSLGKSSASAREFSGDAEFRSARQFSDRFTVTVMDVLPNGNLVISGQRRIAVQGDVRELQLSGIVRQYDILPNNAVPSHLVANLRIELTPQGPEQAYTGQGWFSKKVNKFWPF
ncbi:flagellar basal body L-ring protein FlgH [Stieleria varia]|uniref:Flagellar L-ring protein n=1 Tax=Stieleria varia TaxID=2528005 RepID=A0A5C6ATI5_9BACT|nr:flagellar basal body L-ring protein FlgH [Stieleria varia]TWU02376.1 Flagellar L-ring protein precursor [Stieleria varia]